MDRLADWVSLLLIDGKFYPLFPFLFGLGFAFQMDRLPRGRSIPSRFTFAAFRS